MNDSFTAVVIEDKEGKAQTVLKKLTLTDLPDLDVLVEVAYSGLNYKDGLALSGNKNKVARKLPMVGGIDLAGTVIESRSPLWSAGDKVVLNGFGLSESQWGGYTQYQRVKAEWLLRLPQQRCHVPRRLGGRHHAGLSGACFRAPCGAPPSFARGLGRA